MNSRSSHTRRWPHKVREKFDWSARRALGFSLIWMQISNFDPAGRDREITD